jgi:pantoate--beta-alanine ligase
MQLIHGIAELRQRLAAEPAVVFVPTMGNLHEGHLALVRQAREYGGCVVVSIFVNPLQFGPGEDFDRYPRTLEADCRVLQGLADVVFAPAVAEMYPESQTLFVEPPPIANELCGAARPGHFRGMATVVLKLFNIVQPHVALFGKKDYQQLHIIRTMVRQLNLPVVIVGGETVRSDDGLALSSRNQYLDAAQRAEAPQLHAVLQEVAVALGAGRRDFDALETKAIAALESRGWMVDYVSIREPQALALPSAETDEWVVLAAARLGAPRLLDNIEVFPAR